MSPRPAVALLRMWAYSGHRRFLREPAFASFWVADHVSPAFPPALLTVGNADPPLDHEYQFDLDTDAGRLFFERMATFLYDRLSPGTPSE